MRHPHAGHTVKYVGRTEGPSADQVIRAAPTVLAALGDLLECGSCDIPSAELDVFCVATLNLLAQLSEEYAELAGIGTDELVQLLANKLFVDPNQVRQPKDRQAPLNTDG